VACRGELRPVATCRDTPRPAAPEAATAVIEANAPRYQHNYLAAHFRCYTWVMKNKWMRFSVTLLLGAFIVNVGNMIGGALGNVITIFGGIAIIYAIVEVFRKKPTAISVAE
jgi:hypothetical protein